MRRRVVSLLWNDRARRPRLPWRLLAWIAVALVLGVVATTLVDAVAGRRIESLIALLAPGGPEEQAVLAARNLAFGAGQLFVIVGSVYLAGRFADRRRFRDFGFRLDRGWWLDLGFGLALGALLMTGIFLLELLAGWVTITGLFFIARPDFAFWPWFAWGFVTFLSVGLYEELLFRGYLLTNLAEGFTWFRRVGATGAVGLATLATSVLFGVAHAANPNATLASTAGIVLAALLLAAGYVLTGELAIPIGLHVTWNFFQGTVYGFPVSGTSGGVSLVAVEQSGPSLLTGGAFGPEAGVVGIAAVAVGLGCTVAWVRWREGSLEIDASVAAPELRGSE